IKKHRIPSGPPTNHRVVVSRPEANKLCISVVKTASKAKRLETRVRIVDDVAKLVVVHALGDCPGRRVDNRPGASEVIGENTVRDPTFDNVIRHVGATAIHEATDDVIAPV